MGYLKIPSKVKAGVRETQTNRMQVTSFPRSPAKLPIVQKLVVPAFLLVDNDYTTKTPCADFNYHSALSSKSISAFSQNEGADSQSLLSIVSLPVPPTPLCSTGHCGSSPALSDEASSSLGLCPQKEKTQPMLQKGTAGEIPREQGPTRAQGSGRNRELGTPSLGSCAAIRRGATAVQGELVAAVGAWVYFSSQGGHQKY